MAELIAVIILICSVLGMGVILFLKIPVLTEMPEIQTQVHSEEFLKKIKNRFKNIPFIKSFSFEKFLHKILSRFRILTLKTDSKIAVWLQKLREKSQENKKKERDNYWEELKKSKN